MEILNVRKTLFGYLINGNINVPSDDPEVMEWIKENKEVMPEYTQEELNHQAKLELDIQKSNAKKIGKPYLLKEIEYQVPLDKDAQDTVTAISVAHMAGLFVSTTMEFSNGTKMPITDAEWMSFAQWFVTERNAFFEVVV